ncbi:MAG: flagellar basal body rod protein FlgC [Dehalococcoidia bacterium]|nr:flagellar basal body rod protein FlgC [Dehalococcoidia bacterium]
MGLINAMRATTSGLAAQRVRMDTVSGNVANIDTTRTPEGGAYKRHVVNFASADNALPFANIVAKFSGQASTGVVLTQVTTDTTSPMREAYEPANPDANEDGYVELPNVDLVTEMTDLTSANRSYQANATVLNAIKQMALRALDIGNR